MSCPDFIPNNRPVGVGYDSRGRARSLAELTNVSVSSLSATTSITVPVIVASDGSLIIEGSVSATDGFLGTGGTGATVFPELGDVAPGYTPTPGHIIVITPAGDLSNTPPSSVLTGSYVPTGGVAEDINSLTPTEDTMIYFEGTLASPQITPISDFGRSLIDDLSDTAARGTLGLGSLAIANTVQLSDIEQFPDFGGSDPISGRAIGDLLVVAGGGVFEYAAPSDVFTGGGGGATSLDGLSDVVITGPSTGHTLRYNGTNFVNTKLSHADLLDLSADDHSQYIPVDASRGFTANVSTTAVSPSNNAHLTRKDYVDGQISFAVTYTDTAINDTVIPLINARQLGDATLSALANRATGPDVLLYFSGVDLAASTPFTSFGRTLAGQSTAASTRGSLDLSAPANNLVYFSGSNLPARTGITSAGRDLINLSPVGGDLPYYDGANFVTLPIGPEQALLRVRAGGTAPQWLDPGTDGDVLTIAGGELTWSAMSTGGGVTDHGALTGLGDDDHTQYILANGTRAFSNPVSGSDPTLLPHLATKNYVDTQDNTLVLAFGGALTGKQDVDPTLTALAGASTGTNKLIYFSATDAVATIDFNSTGRSLAQASTALDGRNTLGLSALATRSDLAFLDLTDAFDPAGSEPGAVLVVNSSTNGITWVPSSTFGGGTGSPGGETGSIQYRNGSSFDGDPDFLFDSATNRMSVPVVSATTVSAGTLHLGGSDGFLNNNNGMIVINASQGLSSVGTVSATGFNIGGTIPLGAEQAWTYKYLSASAGVTATANTNITGLNFRPDNNSYYEIEVRLAVQTTSSTVGPRPGLAFSTGTTYAAMKYESPNSNTAAALRFQGAISTQNAASTGLPTITDTYYSKLEGIIKTGTVGSDTFVTLASETSGWQVIIREGSFIRYRKYSV